MMRFLDWLDESAAGVIRIAYLMAGVIAVASYFSDGNVPQGVQDFLNAILPWALAGALEIHTYLSARRVRKAYQDKSAAAIGSDEYDHAEGQMRLNLWILGGLLTFSCYNQLQYLVQTWTPPHIPLTPPGPWPYIIRAVITPSAFMAAAFLAPVGHGMAAEVQGEAHDLAKAAFKVAKAQWKRRLHEMERNGQDVTGALVQLVDDPTERRVIETIHAAMHPQMSDDTGPQVAALSAPSQGDTETPWKPPTGPGSPVRTVSRSKRSTRGGKRPRVLRLNAEKRVREAYAADPSRSIRKLAQMAQVSESTVSKYLRVIASEREGRAAQ